MVKAAYVYLPDDEDDDSQTFGGIRYVLRANQTTEIVEFTQDPAEVERLRKRGAQIAPRGVSPGAVAAHLVTHLGKYGLTVTAGPVLSKTALTAEDQALVNEAERQYLIGTREWAESILIDKAKREKPATDAGLQAQPDSIEEKRARDWLKKYKFL